MNRRATRLAVFALGLLVLASGGAVWYLRSARPSYEGELALPGLTAPVDVWRDSLGVPHVWAENERDLLFAQGYLHARERLWQMELFRRVAEGRLAEVLGADLVESDRFLRTVGLWRAAADQEKQLPPRVRGLLEAYAAGVNAWIARREGALPPELLALRIEPEPWTPRHTLAIEKIMAWDLTLFGDAVSTTRAVRRLGPERARFLGDAYPEWGPTILEVEVPEPPPPAALLLDALSITRASNAWVIGGSRTRSGEPILANDMHLALRAPSLWYLMALHGGGLDVAGMTLPGTPLVIAGHNRAIAWGFTNAMLDDIDLFVERLDPTDSTRYLTPAGSSPFLVASETLRVKGASTVAFDVRITRHGPVLPDLGEGGSSEVIAMRWAAHDPSRTFEGVEGLNRAAGWDDFLAAVRLFDNPHQNVVYADTAGDFGYAMGGRIPQRGSGLPAPVLPVPGWTGDYDWNGYLPFDQHPQVLNPPSGYVVTANNRQVAGEHGDRIGNNWELPFRAKRITDMIVAGRELDADAVHGMQLDVYDGLAERYRHRAIRAARSAGLAEAGARLEEWDLRAVADSRPAAWFHVWYEALRRRVAASLYEGAAGTLPRKALNAVLDSGAVPWLGERGRDVLDSLAVAAALHADSVVDGRTWGDLHSVQAEHALASAPALDRLLDLNVGPAPAGGSFVTVNVSHWAADSFPVRAAYGPSQRHVVDMSDVDGVGGFILPTGQSGIPFDRHYRDQWPRWLGGGLWRIPLAREAAEERAVHRMRLIPEDRP